MTTDGQPQTLTASDQRPDGQKISASLVVGLPVHNERRYIEETLKSLARQDHADFKVLISDNASDDGSGELCASFAAQDSRFIYVRQPQNIGAAGNFNFCLDASSSEHFMWCGAHDTLSDNFLSTMSKALNDDPEVALAFGSRVAIDERSAPIEEVRAKERYVYRFSSNRYLRYAQVACAMSECTIVYGVFRRRYLAGFVIERVQSCDKVLLSHALFHGTLKYEFSATYFRRYFNSRTSTHAERIIGSSSTEGMDDQSLVDYFASDVDSCFKGLENSPQGHWRKKLIMATIRARHLHRTRRHVRFLARLQVQPARTIRALARRILGLPDQDAR